MHKDHWRNATVSPGRIQPESRGMHVPTLEQRFLLETSGSEDASDVVIVEPHFAILGSS